MFWSYVKVSLRNMIRQKGYSLINVVGLAVGMACCMLIMLWVANELSFDNFHENADRIYRLSHHLTIGGSERRGASGSAPMAPAILQQYPEVVNAARFTGENRMLVQYQEKAFYEEGIRYADNSIFEVFTFPMIKGDVESALKAPYSVVITQEIARKYFADEDPVGKTLRIDDQRDFTVTGVVRDVPQNSHFSFDLLCSFQTLYAQEREGLDVWGWFGYYTYLLLDQKSDWKELEEKFPALIETHMGATLQRVGASVELFLQPVSSIHLHSKLQGELTAGGDIGYIYLFSGIAAFILMIACINFVNLSTARSATRAKEVGVRKTLGAGRGKLMRQFLGETVIYGLLSVLVTLILLELGLPLFNSIAGSQLDVNYVKTWWVVPGLVCLALAVGVAAGSYPAFFLSSFRPVNVLKGDFMAGAVNLRFRNLLVVTQFVISIALIIGTITIYQQIAFMKDKELGFDKEQVLVTPDVGDVTQQSIRSIKEELSGLAGVVHVAASNTVPGRGAMMTNFVPEGFSEDESQLMRIVTFDHDFVATLGLELVAGRNFSSDLATDVEESAIINEMAAREFGWEDPVGKIIRRRVLGEAGEPQLTPTKVIGVVKDFHLNSLHAEIEPLYMAYATDDLNTISVRVMPDNLRETVRLLENKWKQIAPGHLFDYYFLDQSFDGMYGAEERLGHMALSFSLLAIFLGCMGLFGLSACTAEQRTKEIGIRKVLGASVPNILKLLSKKMVLLMMIAAAIAAPVAYYALTRWLQDFAYRISVGWHTIVLAAILALLIALATEGYHAVRAALTNPVETLRYE
ncbi:MAG: ABC transporter permease [Candidatus Zixiibacteriota bacterium]|nr:MAG: ABC transporter permease [candidate division Zixibacteria bacterium]